MTGLTHPRAVLKSAPSGDQASTEGRARSRSRRLSSLVLLVACLVPLLTWWHGHQLVWGLDSSFPIRLSDVNRYFQLGSTAYAAPDVRKLSFLLPWGLLLRGWELAGLPWDAGVAQRLYEISMLLAAAFGARALVRQLLPAVSDAAAATAALFYVANAYVLTTVWTSQAYLIVHYSFLPALVLLFTRAMVKGGVLRWSAAGVGWTLLMAPAYITTPLVVTDVGVLVFAGMWTRTARDVAWRRIAVGGATIVGVWAVCNLYWLVPLAKDYSVTFAEGIASISGAQSAAIFRLNSAPLLPALRLGGYWGLTGTLHGSPYYPWASWETPLVDLVAFVPVAFAAVALCTAGTRTSIARSKATQRTLALLGLGLLVLVFLVTAGSAPFASFKVDIFSAVHLLAPFRSVYQRFMEYMPLVIAPLMAAGIDTTARAVGRTVDRSSPSRVPLRVLGATAVWGSAALAVILVPFPLWNGALYARSGALPSSRVSIPRSYSDLAAQLPASSSAALLTLPIGTTNVAYLRWDGGADGFRGIQPLSFMSPLPVIDQAPQSSRIRILLAQGLGQGSLCSALEQLDVGYVAFESDADTAVMGVVGGYLGASLQRTASLLRSTPCLVTAGSGPGLTVYRDVRWVPGLVSFADTLHGPSVTARYVVHPGDVVTVAAPSRRYRYLLLNEPNYGGWNLNGAAPVAGHDVTAFRVPAGPLVLVDGTTTDMRRLLVLAVILIAGVGGGLAAEHIATAQRRRAPSPPGIVRSGPREEGT